MAKIDERLLGGFRRETDVKRLKAARERIAASTSPHKCEVVAVIDARLLELRNNWLISNIGSPDRLARMTIEQRVQVALEVVEMIYEYTHGYKQIAGYTRRMIRDNRRKATVIKVVSEQS